MQNPWIFLVLLYGTFTGEAADLNYNILGRIVSVFQKVSNSTPSERGGGQFSFLMALTPNQCIDNNLNLTFIPGSSAKPNITWKAMDFVNFPEANYIAVYPYPSSKCSESKILHRLPNKSTSAAKIFANNTRNRREPVGCVIFYTTYTPCTNRCFSNKERQCIVKPISELATEWPDQNTGKYLVFSKVYQNDTGKVELEIVRKKMGEVADSGFSITKCDREPHDVACVPCNAPNYCIDPIPTGTGNNKFINHANCVTIAILLQRQCGLSECVTRYLVGMSTADLLVVILDIILRHIPIVYWENFAFLRYSIPVCNIHAVLLYTATDCSVWFTVAFTVDRFVAICCQKLKSKICNERTVAAVLGTVTVLSCLKNSFWYFMLGRQYWLMNNPWFCAVTVFVQLSPIWAAIEFVHHVLTPCVPFFLILLLNVLTVRHILASSRSRRRLRTHCSGQSPKDPEMESRRKSIILLFVISANFILLWSVFMVNSIWWRMYNAGYEDIFLHEFVRELGFMMQLLSCCTNTCIYAVTQTKFRENLMYVLRHPNRPICQLLKCQALPNSNS